MLQNQSLRSSGRQSWKAQTESRRHVSRRNSDSIERLVVQGKVEGTRPRGRSPVRWTDQVKSAVGTRVSDCTRQSANRERWREIVRRVVSASTTDVDASTCPRPLCQERNDREEEESRRFVAASLFSLARVSKINFNYLMVSKPRRPRELVISKLLQMRCRTGNLRIEDEAKASGNLNHTATHNVNLTYYIGTCVSWELSCSLRSLIGGGTGTAPYNMVELGGAGVRVMFVNGRRLLGLVNSRLSKVAVPEGYFFFGYFG
ncbi:unnamed protein product [Spodoptera exigua]|nr:unnamed protein product [Spodoptera exigua]